MDLRRALCCIALSAPLATNSIAAAPSSHAETSQDDEQEDVSGDEIDAPETALDRALRARSLDPEDPEALEQLSRLHAEEGDVDSQAAFLLLAIDAVDKAEYDDEKDRKKKLDDLQDELDDLDLGLKSIRKARRSYLKDLTWSLRLYAGNQNKRRNALALGERILDYRPDHPIANDAIERMLDELSPKLREDAERILYAKELSRPRSFLTEWAKEHGDWENAGTFESERYIVRTNAGYDVGQIASKSLAAIARYFEEFYGVDRSLITRKTEVMLCKTRKEFEEVAANPITDNPGLQAFISTRMRSGGDDGLSIIAKVYGFDPRDQGRPLDSLWPTLWHEASHEYMQLVTQMLSAPLWVNEGMSSYFEGASFSKDGKISVGLPSFERLGNLYAMLERGDRPLKDLTRATGSLTAEQYAAAWGVIYYVAHGRDEAGKLLRPDALRTALEIVGDKMVTGAGLFEAAVLDGQNFDEFETEWIAWIQDLHVAEEHPEERALTVAELGSLRAKTADPKKTEDAPILEDARVIFREALLRDPDCIPAMQGLADIAYAQWRASKKRDDDQADLVLLWGRKLHDAAIATGDEVLAESSLELCEEVDRVGFEKVADAEEDYLEDLDKVIGRLISNDRPRTAVAIAELYVDDVLGTNRAAQLSRELRMDGVLELERPFVAFDGKSLEGLSASTKNFRVEEDLLIGTSERPWRSPLFIERPLSPRFRFEGDVRFEDGNTVLAVCFSAPETGIMEGFAVRPKASDETEELNGLYPPFDFVPDGHASELTQRYIAARFGIGYALDGKPDKMSPAIEPGKWVRFVLESDEPGVLRLLIDGEVVGTREIPESTTEATVGLLIYGGVVEIYELMAFEIDRL